MAQDDVDYDSIIAVMEAQRDSMNAAIEGVKMMRRLQGGGGQPSQVSPSGEVRIESGTFFGMSIPSATEKYLRMTPKVLRSTKEIADALQQGGFETESARFFNTVYNSLFRYTAPDGNFVKVGKKWGLAEWYPGHKPKARRGATEISEEDDREISEETGDPMESITELSSTSVS
jgi:hypothetical protein